MAAYRCFISRTEGDIPRLTVVPQARNGTMSVLTEGALPLLPLSASQGAPAAAAAVAAPVGYRYSLGLSVPLATCSSRASPEQRCALRERTLRQLKLPVQGCGRAVHGAKTGPAAAEGPPARCAADARSGAPSSFKLLCYGDSLTVGSAHPGPVFEAYGHALARELSTLMGGRPCQVSVCGHHGLSAAAANAQDPEAAAGMGMQALLATLEELKPDMVLVMLGTEDLMQGGQIEQIIANICQVHRRIHELGVSTFVMSPPQLSQPHGALAETVRKCLATMLSSWASAVPGVASYVNTTELVPPVPGCGHYTPDGCFLTALGSQRLGQRLAPLLARLGQKGD